MTEISTAAPIRPSLSIPVDVVNVSSPSLRTHSGFVRHFDDGVYDIELADLAADLDEGVRVVLNLQRPVRRITATVTRRWPRRIMALERRAVLPDNRVYPRLVGGIPLRYQVVTGDVEGILRSWREGETLPGTDWVVPDPFMNFSVGGVRFYDDARREAGELMLVELGVAQNPARWRALAEVVRVCALAEDEMGDYEASEGGEAAFSVAIQFIDLPADARDALTEYTLLLQRAGL